MPDEAIHFKPVYANSFFKPEANHLFKNSDHEHFNENNEFSKHNKFINSLSDAKNMQNDFQNYQN